jgi:DNA polymerase (family 10)
MHTTASDGANTIEEMIAACRARGYSCMAICDHSQSQIQANGLDAARLARHVRDIRAAASKYDDVCVLAGVEVDIFKDGSLDFDADVLSGLDFVTASPHSALSLGRTEATARLIRAIEHPCVHCIGHPSGRLINARPGMELDIEAIAAAAAANNVALEVNAHYMRLDLRDTHVRAAVGAGAKIIISTDAHRIEDLDMMRYGVTTARRGWARAEDVINTWPIAKIRRWLAPKGLAPRSPAPKGQGKR